MIKPAAFIKGRTIFENIIVAQDAIFISNKQKRPLAIISVDQTKAFDRINRRFMLRVLRKFGLGDSFISWVTTLYQAYDHGSNQEKTDTRGFQILPV